MFASPGSFREEAQRPGWPAVLRALLPPTGLGLLCLLGAGISFLLFHALAELFSIVIALTALVVATTSRQFTKNHLVVFIAVGVGWCAALDLIHTLAYKGMGLLPIDSANPATQLWIAARFIQAVTLLAAPLFLRRSVDIRHVHAGFGLAALLAVLAIAGGAFPDAFVEGVGLTPFKIYAEYLIIFLLAGALALIWRHRTLMTPTLFLSLMAAVVAMMLSEFAFTRYVSVYSNANMVGHLLKIYAYWFVYLALVQNTLREPFSLLARAASSYDAVPDPTLLVNRQGLILQANRAAAQVTGRSAEQLVGQSSHNLWHDAQTEPGACPVCQAIAQGQDAQRLELKLGDGLHTVECSLSPFTTHAGHPAYVQVIRDISERKRHAAEREKLVYDLGERIKELRCLYTVSGLIETPGLAIPDLLAGVASALPPAFRYPDQAMALIRSEWGDFGDPACLNAEQRLTYPILVHDQQPGSITLAYRQPLPGTPFLPEEVDLMETVAQRVSDTLQSHQDNAKIRRLSYLYEMLSATNRAVVRCRSSEELLQALHEALLTHGTFNMFFIALAREGQPPFHISCQHGIAAEHLAELETVLANPASTFGQIQEELLKGQVVLISVPHQGASDGWINYLQQQHIHERAILPLLQEGRLLGVAGLYAGIPNAFDADELRLLNEMATDIAFALTNLTTEHRRQAAEQHATLSEHRFREVFESSPLPMQIHSVRSGTIRAINRAHQQWLGYPLEEIADENQWLEQVYADAHLRDQVRALWHQDLRDAQGSLTPIRSPELCLRCKDGSERIAQGTMTVVGDDVIVAWTDLTASRRDEAQIRRYIGQLEGSMKSTLQVLSNMVEMRDPYTAGHERRVGLIAGAIARELGWAETQCATMELIGLVHDIGKIAVPAEILSKPTRLTHLEMELVRCHAQAGYDILKDVEFTAPVAQVIHQHHERMDGSGYPLGLKGAEILKEARILAVADVLESMAAHRPYRPALGVDAALAELEKGSGQLYDPEIVTTIVQMVRENGYRLPE